MNIETILVADLIPYARNARTHSDAQVAQIAASIKEFGFCNPVLIDAEAGIIAGHGRVLAARKLGMTEVPCIRLGHLTDVQRRAYILADNRLAELAGWDTEMLALEIADLRLDDVDLELLGFDDDGLRDLLGEDDQEQGLTDPDATPDVPVTPVCKPGDLWILGNHRLLCGDSTKEEDVARLMAGEMAKMVITDPPYGVSYVGKTKDALKVENDDVPPDELKLMCEKWFDNVDKVLADGGYVLATVPPGPLHLIFADDWKSRGWLRQIMVWNKDSMVLGHSEYHYKHEPILFGWKPGDRLKNQDRTKTTVWDFKRPKASKDHPTMKPVEMWSYAITNHSKKEWLLYEPFSGSGTTIIACEQTGRRCYAIEISPAYVDVAVRRWQDFTGQIATHADTGQPFPAHG